MKLWSREGGDRKKSESDTDTHGVPELRPKGVFNNSNLIQDLRQKFHSMLGVLSHTEKLAPVSSDLYYETPEE